jgi:hypothetical protein
VKNIPTKAAVPYRKGLLIRFTVYVAFFPERADVGAS